MNAVITGDIIHSRKIKERPELTEVLNETFEVLKKEYFPGGSGFEIYRGDSFQGMLSQPSQALKMALLLKSRLKFWQYTSSGDQRKKTADARIAIGIGDINYRGATIGESDGEAFHNAAKVMELLEAGGDKLGILTPWEEINDILRISTQMAGVIMDQWSAANAEAVYWSLLKNDTQQALSDRLGISQPAVNKRLQGAHYSVISAYLEFYNRRITKSIR